jgi:hypothetical protein
LKKLKYPSKSHIRITIQDAILLAESRNGKCLSENYIPEEKLIWKCSDGHIWQAQYSNVSSGKWCPHCNINYGEEFCRLHLEWIFNKNFVKCRPDFLRNPSTGACLELDGYCPELGIAFEHHGQQHYFKSFLSNEDLKYRQRLDNIKVELCQKYEIKLLIIPDVFNIIKPENCLKEIYNQLNTLNVFFVNKENEYDFYHFLRKVKIPSSKLLEVKNYCNKLGGDCLSTVYLGTSIKLEFVCKNNHIWLSEPRNILRGKWCKQCYLELDPDGEKFLSFKEIVESKNGKLLESKFLGTHAHHLIECEKGHTWKTYPSTVVKSWCPECFRLSLVNDIDDIKEHIKNNNGILLTDESLIRNSKDKITIKCENNHLWEVEINSLRRRKHWCRFCSL